MNIADLRGVAASVVLTGTVTEEFSKCWMEMRAYCIENGLKNIEWIYQQAPFVEFGRDQVCTHALNENYDFVLMADADATFPPNALHALLKTAFEEVPDADVVGAYAQLRSKPHLPVLDTGTGTWEPHFPGEGTLKCIRTGGHFLLIKTSALRKFGPPWFSTRQTLRPVDALREVDNFARVNMHGKNPFSEKKEWKELLEKAQEEKGGVSSQVGEDSGFCDALLAAGGSLYVNTNVVTGHVSRFTINASHLRDEMKKRDRLAPLSVGVY